MPEHRSIYHCCLDRFHEVPDHLRPPLLREAGEHEKLPNSLLHRDLLPTARHLGPGLLVRGVVGDDGQHGHQGGGGEAGPRGQEGRQLPGGGAADGQEGGQPAPQGLAGGL